MLADTVGVDFVNEKYASRWFRNPEDGNIYALQSFGNRTADACRLETDADGGDFWSDRVLLESSLFQDLSIFAYPELGYRQYKAGLAVYLTRPAGVARGLYSKLLTIGNVGGTKVPKEHLRDATLARMVFAGEFLPLNQALARLLDTVPYNRAGAEALSNAFALVATPRKQRPNGEPRVYEVHYAQKCVGTVNQDGVLNITSGSIKRLLAKVA